MQKSKTLSSKTRRVLIALCVLAAVLGLLLAAYMWMNARTFQLFGTLISRVDTDEHVAYLTFDDGPTGNTPRILKKLDELDVRATFFLIGSSMAQNTGLTEAIINAGHDIGSHTYSHKRMIFKPLSFVSKEVDKTNAMIKSLGYDREIFFRPPNGKKLVLLPWYLNKIGQTTVMWTLEPETDPDVSKDAPSMAQYVVDHVSDGAIILLHPMNDDTDKTLDAVALIVDGLRKKGYRFETLSSGL